jgi:hypothetical protein
MRRAFLAFVTIVAAGCTDLAGALPPPAPSASEAQAYLDGIVTIALSGDLTHLCDAGSGTCEQNLRAADPRSVPMTRPTVLGSRVLASVRTSAGWSIGGRVLELCGHDGMGALYGSEILVFREGNRLVGKDPVFWVGIRIADSNATATGPIEPPASCPT